MIGQDPSKLAQAIINNIEEVIFLFDSEGRLIYFNKAAEEFIGSKTKDVYNNMHFANLFQGSKDITTLIQKALLEGRLFNCKDINIELNRSINVDFYLYPFYSNSDIEGVIVCIRENRLLMERDDYPFDSLLGLLGAIAHEIKNPLSGIKGAAQLLKNKELNNDKRQYINLIIKETDRLNSILYDYLSLSRKPAFTDINIHEVIEHALKVMELTLKEKKIQLYKSYDPSLPNISGDASKLLQVFINLIKNAVEAMEKSKRIKRLSISTKPANEYIVLYDSDHAQSRHPKSKKQRWININFEDTGKGIPEGELNKIFLPFYSKKHGGTGLGLALSKKIIKDHGGTIMVNPRSKKGAIFTVYLPF